jgi:hypothetical protein
MSSRREIRAGMASETSRVAYFRFELRFGVRLRYKLASGPTVAFATIQGDSGTI